LSPELQLLTRIVLCGSQLWAVNTHGVQEQLKLLQGLGSLLWSHFEVTANCDCNNVCTFHFVCPCNKCSSLPCHTRPITM